VEKYGDLITNGLDLISFLLVTPEIVKVIAPAANVLVRSVWPRGRSCLHRFAAKSLFWITSGSLGGQSRIALI
jgi:hypothetical protein